MTVIKGERKLLTYSLCDNTLPENFLFYRKFVFRGVSKFYIFYYNNIFKIRVLFK